MNKVVSMEEAISHVEDGMSVIIGGFMGAGNPHKVIDALIEKGLKDITIIANDTAVPGVGIGKLIENKRAKKLIATHIGLNPETGNQMNAGELDVTLVPQGTLIEQIRAGGAGLGGVLTPTGVGTIVEEGKQKLEIDGKVYLLEKPIKADVALIFGSIVDKKGNIFFNKATRNFNKFGATAAETVIVEAEKLVEVGELDPNCVEVPGLFVDYIVRGDL